MKVLDFEKYDKHLKSWWVLYTILIGATITFAVYRVFVLAGAGVGLIMFLVWYRPKMSSYYYDPE